MGTPDYMAPEQALDTRSADHRADIYSLGCTLYFLVSGRPPFPGGSLTEKLLAHQQREPAPIDRLCSGAPARLVEVLAKAMAKQPNDRFQSAAEFANALTPLEHAEQILAAVPMPTITAFQTMQKPHAETATDTSLPPVRKPQSSSKAIWALVA